MHETDALSGMGSSEDTAGSRPEPNSANAITAGLKKLLIDMLEWFGGIGGFSLRVMKAAVKPPYEGRELLRQMDEVGARSLPLVALAGAAIGAVLSMHTRDSMAQFGAKSMLPTLIILSLVKETGPIITALVVSGRVGAGIGAELGSGLLGSKYVAVSFGSAEAEPVGDGDMIESRASFDYSDLARSAREMIDTAKETLDSSKVAIANVNEASDYLRAITGKINSGQGSIGALVNDRSFYRDLQATVGQARVGVTAFQEDMEALKHNFFLRGFFKRRGYYDSSELTDHAIGQLPRSAPLKQYRLAGRDLFSKPDTAKLKNEKLLNQIGGYLKSNPFGLAVIVAHTGAKGEKQDNLKLSQARAMVVRQYLAQKFRIDDTRIRTMSGGEADQTASPEGDIAIVVYPAAPPRVIQAKNK